MQVIGATLVHNWTHKKKVLHQLACGAHDVEIAGLTHDWPKKRKRSNSRVVLVVLVRRAVEKGEVPPSLGLERF